jgi:hypothetical protein
MLGLSLAIVLATGTLEDSRQTQASTTIPVSTSATSAPGHTSAVLRPQGGSCIEPTGLSDPTHPSYVQQTFYNQWGCKIPLRTGKKDFGYNHIVLRATEQMTAGEPNSHEVTPFAQRLWKEAIERPGGTLLLSGAFFVASVMYQTARGDDRTMCVFLDTSDLKYAGRYYKVKGIVTAYWIEGHSAWPSESCRDARRQG